MWGVLSRHSFLFTGAIITALRIRYTYRLLWRSESTTAPDSNSPGVWTPPAGLVPAGEGADPGLFDVDSTTGTISALPRRNGNFSMYLLVVDTAGIATTLGFAAELDQVVVKRWSFEVVGKPDFSVTNYGRKQTSELPKVSSGEEPYITRTLVGSIDCTVGTMYHIAPIDNEKLEYSHASGGDQAKIRFTIRNPPPGFFIEPSTGEVQGIPQAASAGGTFASTLLAVDPAGQEAVLEEMVFTILPKPRFVPVFEPERSAAAVDYADPSLPSQTFVVGRSYKIATFVLNTTLTQVSAGSAADITYTLSADAPDSFCVQARSGDISGSFLAPGAYSFAVLAVDQAGEVATAEQLTINVLEQPEFRIAVGSARTHSGPEYALPSGTSSSAFYVKESYRFSPLQLNESNTAVSSGTFQDITYTLDSEDGWFVSAKTGEIFGQFSRAGLQNMTLYAVDSAGKQAVVEQMLFDVTNRPVFDLVSGNDPSAFTLQQVGLLSADLASAAAVKVQYAVGSTIKFPPMDATASALFVNPAFDEYSRVTYKRTFGAPNNSSTNASASPGLWLVDTETAEMLAQPDRAGNYSVSLVATDAAGAEVTFRQWSFEVLLKDVDVPEYGPNGVDCANNGNRVDIGNAIFDNRFQCNCDGTGHNGDNCEIKILPTVCSTNEALVDGVCKPFQLAAAEDGARTAAGPEFTDPTAMQGKYYTVREFASYRIAPLAIDGVRTNFSSGNQSDATYTMVGDTDGFFLNTKTGQMLGTFDNFAGGDGGDAAGDNDAAQLKMAASKRYSITLQVIDGSGVHQDLETIEMNVRYPDLTVDAYGPNGKPCENNGTRSDGADGAGDMYDQSYVCKCVSAGITTYSGDNCEIAVEASSSSTGDGGSGNTPVVAGSMAGAVIFLFCVGLIAYKRRMYKHMMKAFDFKAEVARLISAGEIDEGDGDGGADLGPKIPREIKRSHIVMIKQIGEGAFGEVWHGVLDESSAGGVPGYNCAVKTSKDAKGEGAEEMLREATVMAQVSGHPNLVSLIGVVTSGVPLLLAISMCETGSLLSLLKERKLKGNVERKAQFTLAERIGFAIDTAKGMAHLTANSFVHRDLAARNVLVDATMNCKVADFGLARGIAGARAGPGTNEDGGDDEEEYYRSRTGTFPVRWTSPEAMQTMRFSEATDVWSFGIVMIELFTDGGKPYAGMANAAVITKVQGGYRAEQPKLCTDQMYAIMLECWAAKATNRPTFAKLVAELEGIKSSVASISPRVSATLAASSPRQAVAVNDTYMTDEPAAPAADQYLTVDNTESLDSNAADDEYLSVATGVTSSAADNNNISEEFEC